MLQDITQDSIIVNHIAEQVNRIVIDTYVTPLFTIALFVGNAVVWLPEAMLPHRPWRAILLRFFSDDDLKLNKSDMKDGTMVTLAFWLGKFAIHFGTHQVLTGKDHNELIYQFLGASAVLLGVNAGAAAYSKRTEVMEKNTPK